MPKEPRIYFKTQKSGKPFLIQGPDALKIHRVLEKGISAFDDTALNLDQLDFGYDELNQGVYGGSFILNGVLYRVVAHSSLRPVIPGDDSERNVFRLVMGKNYAVFNSMVVQGNEPSNVNHRGLWNKVIEMSECFLEREVKFPFRVDGFYIDPDNSRENPFLVEPARNFQVVEDERYLPRFNESTFTDVDSRGLPELSKNQGSRTWYTSPEGLSMVFLGGAGYINNGYKNFNLSSRTGRMVLVREEA